MRYDLRGKNALVTGGARGLGLARVLVARGANVAVVARDEDEIARGLDSLRRGNHTVALVGDACDLTDGDAIGGMLRRVQRQLGPLDVLINNAGMIQVGPLDAMTLDDFEQAMALHYFAPLRTMLGVRDTMRARGGGRIVNIASVGGLVSVPHLLPYSASKFALVGLSQGMRSELARDNICVTTVEPGLMRTGSPRQALFKGDHEKEYAWFAVSDSLPLLSMSAERAARRIVRALERGKPNLVLGAPAKLAGLANALAPNLTARALTLVNRLLPRGDDTTARKGYQSQSAVAPSVLTTLTERAATRNNER
jgi:short-subunit dehydrogenase